MILVPERVKNLLDYAKGCGSEECVLSFYILSPSPATLRKRLQSRGDNESEIVKRITDCDRWDEEARKAVFNGSIPYIFIKNDTDDSEDAVDDMISFIDAKMSEPLF